MTARRRRLQKQRQNSLHARFAEIAALVVVTMLVLALSGTAVAASTIRTWLKDLPNPDAPGAFEVAQATQIYSADGKLLARLYLENRTVIPLEDMSENVRKAIVAIEDERFYQHHGIDFLGLARAVVVNLEHGFGEEGASTITQQYVRNTILLDERTDITMARKIREAYLALELEKRYKKPQILGMYLNAIYFGEGAYGIEAASRTYFSKHASELSLAEAALLAGLPQQPGRLDPYDNPDFAVERRNVVLKRMLEQKLISADDYTKAVDAPLKLKRAKDPEDGVYSAHFFVAHVKKLLQAQFTAGTVFKGGLKVYTTLDTKHQAQAEAAIKHRLPGGPEIALVSLDPRNGRVVALVGGRNYRKNKFNLATQGKRQPGSSFKTFTLVAALQEGMPPSYMVDSSSPAYIPTKPKAWVVSNSEGSGHGAMTLAKATALSVNTVFARVAYGIGAKNVVRTAEKMGIQTDLQAYPSIALGAQNVTPLEMASAYGTLANDGKHYKTTFITKVVDKNGKTLLEAEPEGKQVIKPSIAYAATQILKGVVQFGTGTRARIGRPQAGKTGTSQNNRDVWFVGYTPQLVTSIWVGYRTEQTIYVNGSRAFGGTVCAPIWAEYMRNALRGEKVMDFKHEKAPNYNGSKFRKIPHGTPATSTVDPTSKPHTNPKPKPDTGGGNTGGGTGGGGNGGGDTGGNGGGDTGGNGGGNGGGTGGGGGGGETSGTP